MSHYLTTTYTERNTLWEAGRRSVDQKLSRLWWKLKVHYRVHKNRRKSLFRASFIQSTT